MLALQRASSESWPAVQGEAHEVRRLANALLPTLSSHDFTRDDMKALANGIIALGLTGEGVRYSEAEQATMGLAAIFSAVKSSGNLSEDQLTAITRAMNGLYGSFASDETYRHEPFVKALGEFRRTVPR